MCKTTLNISMFMYCRRTDVAAVHVHVLYVHSVLFFYCVVDSLNGHVAVTTGTYTVVIRVVVV